LAQADPARYTAALAAAQAALAGTGYVTGQGLTLDAAVAYALEAAAWRAAAIVPDLRRCERTARGS